MRLRVLVLLFGTEQIRLSFSIKELDIEQITEFELLIDRIISLRVEVFGIVGNFLLKSIISSLSFDSSETCPEIHIIHVTKWHRTIVVHVSLVRFLNFKVVD